MNSWQTGKSTYPKPYFKSTKVERASPGNPLVYKTLGKVKIRSGKSGGAADVCSLPKGSIVTINQTHGRWGRVVLPQKDGQYIKLGWVTLYTQNGQQLLKTIHQKNRVTQKKTMRAEH